MQCLFALLSGADLGLTWWLLNRSGGRAYEANPLARWFLDQHGWLGMAAFKAGTVLLVLGLVIAIARTRPRAAGRILSLGCAALALIVLYSLSLCRMVAHAQETEQAVFQRKEMLDEQVQKIQRHTALRARLIDELLTQRCTLRDAVLAIDGSELSQDASWKVVLQRYQPGLSRPHQLASYLIFHVVLKVLQSPDAWEIVYRLEQQFEEMFATPAPRRHREILQRLREAKDTPAGEADRPFPGITRATQNGNDPKEVTPDVGEQGRRTIAAAAPGSPSAGQ
jgi:hypothetical protein